MRTVATMVAAFSGEAGKTEGSLVQGEELVGG